MGKIKDTLLLYLASFLGFIPGDPDLNADRTKAQTKKLKYLKISEIQQQSISQKQGKNIVDQKSCIKRMTERLDNSRENYCILGNTGMRMNIKNRKKKTNNQIKRKKKQQGRKTTKRINAKYLDKMSKLAALTKTIIQDQIQDQTQDQDQYQDQDQDHNKDQDTEENISQDLIK